MPPADWLERVASALERDVTAVRGDDRPTTVRAVRETIEAGRPIIAAGLAGDVRLVTGYDRGSVLRVWRAGDVRAAEVSDWWVRRPEEAAPVRLVIGDRRR